MAKIAPTLQALLTEPVKGVPMLAAYHGEAAVKELRALLAVARAATDLNRTVSPTTDFARTKLDRLDTALARLDKASGRKGDK